MQSIIYVYVYLSLSISLSIYIERDTYIYIYIYRSYAAVAPTNAGERVFAVGSLIFGIQSYMSKGI